MFRFTIWLIGRLRSQRQDPGLARYAAATAAEPVTVRLPDGRLVMAERAEQRRMSAGPGPNERLANARTRSPTFTLTGPPDGPGARHDPRPRRRHWYSAIPRWLRWTVLVVIAGAVFRRAVAWALLAALSATVHLPHVAFGWPWSSASSSSTLVSPLVLQKIEGIDKPALGTTTFNFLFTHKVSRPMAFLPCWYSATFYAVAHASASVNLNPGPSWWEPSAGHYTLRVLSRPSGSAPGTVSVTMTLPAPQLPQSVHDVSVDDTLSRPVSSDHSWTYPGVACGDIINPQFSQSVLYAQAQDEAFRQATAVTSVTRPLIAAAEKEAATIIGDNFVTPTLNALHYKVGRFTIRWAAPIVTG